MSLGCLQSALELYERLEMWEEMAECLQSVGRTGRAEEVLRQQLAVSETPTLWCLLGDVTKVTVGDERLHNVEVRKVAAGFSFSSPLLLPLYTCRSPATIQKLGSCQTIVVPEHKGHLVCITFDRSTMRSVLRAYSWHSTSMQCKYALWS